METADMLNFKSVPSSACEFRFIHSSGPGGQHVNKTATAVELRVEIELLSLNAYASHRLHMQQAKRISKEGILVIQASSHRSQLKNRQEALARVDDFIKEAKKHTSKKATTDANRKERNFWLFSLSSFASNPILICAKASGSESILNAVNGLQEFSTKLLEKCLEFHTITKNIAKQMKQPKLFESSKEESQSPSAKRARAQEALEKPVGVSLPQQLGEARPVPVHLGG